MNTVSKVRKVLYMAVSFATGVADFVVTVRKPNGDVLDPAPVMSEVGEGVYTFSYTPDVVGVWQEKIASTINGDKVIRGFDVVAIDVSDVDTKLGTLEGKVDAVKTQTNATEAKVDLIDGVVDATKVVVDDSKVVIDATKAKVDITDSKVDTIDGVVDATKIVVDVTQTKVDTVTGKIDAIKSVVDAINVDVGFGGYFIN